MNTTKLYAAQKQHDAIVKYDMYRNLQRHRAVLPARLSCIFITSLLNGSDGQPNDTSPQVGRMTIPKARMGGNRSERKKQSTSCLSRRL